MSADFAISPIQLLIDSQKSIANELVEQRKINTQLSEAIYKLSSEIKILSHELKRHDQLEEQVGLIAKDMINVKQIIQESIDSKMSSFEDRVKTIERNMYKVIGIIGFVVFAVSVVGALSGFFLVP